MEPLTGSVGAREAGREARALGDVAEGAVESRLTLIDGSITERGEGFSPRSPPNPMTVTLAPPTQYFSPKSAFYYFCAHYAAI